MTSKATKSIGGEKEGLYIVHTLVALLCNEVELKGTCASSAGKNIHIFFFFAIHISSLLHLHRFNSEGLRLKLKSKCQKMQHGEALSLANAALLCQRARTRPGSGSCPSISAALPAFPCWSQRASQDPLHTLLSITKLDVCHTKICTNH